MERNLHVLLVEDSATDAELILHDLKKGGFKVFHERVYKASDLRKALKGKDWDIILSDYTMPGFGGREALKIYKKSGLDIPFIIVTGTVGEETAVETMIAGAHDYVMKDRLQRLVPAIKRELKECRVRRMKKQADKELVESERRFRLLFDNAGAGIAYYDLNGVALEFNQQACHDMGGSADDFVGKSMADLFGEIAGKVYVKRIQDTAGAKTNLHFEDRVVLKSGPKWFHSVYAPVFDEEGRVNGVQIISHDITKRKLAEEALRESEQRFRSLYENATIGLYRTTPEGRILLANPFIINLLGYESFDELAKRNLEDQGFHPTYPRAEFRRILEEKGQVVGFESAWHTKDGALKYIRESARAVRDESGRIMYFDGTVEDITEYKRAERLLEKEKEKAQLYLEIAPTIMLALDRTGKITLINHMGCEILGGSYTQIIGKNWFDEFINKERNPDIRNIFNDLMSGKLKSHDTVEDWITTLDGKDRYIRWQNTVIKDENGSITGTFSSGVDITLEKEHEQHMQFVHDLYRRTISNAGGIPYSLKYEAGQYEFFGDQCEALLGVPKEKLSFDIMQNLAKEIIIVDKEFRGDAKTYTHLFKQGKVHRYLADLRIITPAGEEKWVSDCSLPIHDPQTGNVIGSQGILQDITDRKQAERALRESEERLDMAVRSAGLGLWDQDFESGTVVRNDMWYKMLGFSRKDIDTDKKAWLDLVHPDDIKKVNEVIRLHEQGKSESFSIDHRIRTKDGNWKWILNTGKIVKRDNNGKPLRALGVHIDIDKRKQIESALRDSEAFLHHTGAMARVGGWEIDLKNKTVYWTKVTKQIHEVPDDYTPTLEEAINFFPGKYKKIIQDAVTIAMEKGKSYDLELGFKTAKNNLLWVRTMGYPEMQNGRCVRLWGVFQDITENKRAQIAIENSNADLKLIKDMNEAVNQGKSIDEITNLLARKTSRLFKSHGVSLFLVGENGKFLRLHNIPLQKKRLALLQKLLPLKIPQVILPLNRNIKYNYIDKHETFILNERDQIEKFVHDFCHATAINSERLRKNIVKLIPKIVDVIRIKSVIILPLIDDNKLIGQFILSSEDNFTDNSLKRLKTIALEFSSLFKRKQTETALISSEQRYHSLFDNMFSGVAVYEPVDDGKDFVFVDLNKTGQRLSSVSKKDVVGKKLTEVFPGVRDLGLLDSMKKAWKTGKMQHCPLRLYEDKRIKEWVENDVYKLPTGQIVNIYQDTSEKHKALEALRETKDRLKMLSNRLLEVQENERHFLARELHDQIGQLLTAIKINLQTRAQRQDAQEKAEMDREILDLVDNAASQVRNLSVDLRPSILDDLGLVPAIRWYINKQTEQLDVDVYFDAPSDIGALKPEIEINCFRMVQELLNNIIKHAGAEKISVSVKKHKNELVVKIEDDGVGFDVHAARNRAGKGASFGILSVEERANLSGGTFEISSAEGKGTEATMRFALK